MIFYLNRLRLGDYQTTCKNNIISQDFVFFQVTFSISGHSSYLIFVSEIQACLRLNNLRESIVSR